MIPRTNRLVGDSPKEPSGFNERAKPERGSEEKLPAPATGYVNERLSAEASLRSFYYKTIPKNHVNGSR